MTSRSTATAVLLVIAITGGSLHAQTASSQPTPQPAPASSHETPFPPSEDLQFAPEAIMHNLKAGLEQVAFRLPWAAVLGTVLALRPRRAGSPQRDAAVIETQIVLAIVGALIMLVVGASLARAFGIAGAANLIRYRAKIEDPKDAVVMLAALSVGLASGVGLFGIATAATGFLVLTLWIIEGFENRVRTFLLTVKLGERTSEQRMNVERILKRSRALYELRTTGDDSLSYLVNAGDSLDTERMSEALTKLAPDGKAHIEWKEESKAKPLPEKDAA
jgi:hypothetical protein